MTETEEIMITPEEKSESTDASAQKEPEKTVSLDGDLAALKEEFPELSEAESIADIKNPTRYGALRDLGLSPAEAYAAVAYQRPADSRAHLTSSVPARVSTAQSTMSIGELRFARELFEGLPDKELERLYKRVTN